MKKVITMLLMAVAMNAFADEWYDESTGFTWYYTISGDAATLTGCSPKEGMLPPLPSVLGGKTVTIINDNAFNGCSGFTGSLTIPKSVTTIGSSAFYNCSGFSGSLIIPNSVVTIGDRAFHSCKGFSGSLTIPDSVMTIGSAAFGVCSGFTGSLTISASVTKIRNHTFTGCSGFTGCLIIPNSVTIIEEYAFYGCSGFSGLLTIPDGVTTIGARAFYECSGFTGSLTIPDSVISIGTYAFRSCGFSGLLTIGEGVEKIDSSAFYCCYGLVDVMFCGAPMEGWNQCLFYAKTPPSFFEKYATEWKMVFDFKNLRELMREGVPVAKVISAKMRESDPTIMDVVYKVTSTKPTVKVRALAFQDGERSFAKVVRPETFVEDENGKPTAGNIGDGVTANEEHTLSWKVSADWQTTLAKVKFEVLAVEDEILPLELVTLPKTETQPKMVFSWNYVIPSRAFDALLWLYADKDLGLTLTDGVLKNGTVRLADGASCDKTSYDALVYIYGKMGYELLQGGRLDYVRERSRLDLPGISERQYAVKVIEE